jgi:hypothetical protein
VRSFSIKRTTDAIISSSIWNEANQTAFVRINERRKLRNILAHFFAKRFVSEDAFMFMTKSAADYEQVYGSPPSQHRMLYGVIDAQQVRNSIAEIKHLLRWMEKVPQSLSTPVAPP